MVTRALFVHHFLFIFSKLDCSLKANLLWKRWSHFIFLLNWWISSQYILLLNLWIYKHHKNCECNAMLKAEACIWPNSFRGRISWDQFVGEGGLVEVRQRRRRWVVSMDLSREHPQLGFPSYTAFLDTMFGLDHQRMKSKRKFQSRRCFHKWFSGEEKRPCPNGSGGVSEQSSGPVSSM